MKKSIRFCLLSILACTLLTGSASFAQDNSLVVSVLDYYEGLEGLGDGTVTVEQILPLPAPPPTTGAFVAMMVPSNAVLNITVNPVNVGTLASFPYKWIGDIPESYQDRNPPHPPTIRVSVDGENRDIEVLLSREYHAGEGVGDLDLDGLPDVWEIKFDLDPEDATDVLNDTGDRTMPTEWNNNIFSSGNYPAAAAGLTLTSAYVPHIGDTWYKGSEPFTLWLECRGFDGWYGDNPLLAGLNDDPGTDPRKLDTSNDGLPDGWKYWFYASFLHNNAMEGVALDIANYLDINVVAPEIAIPNATVLAAFKPTTALGADLDSDCASDGTATDAVTEYQAGTDPIHWDTDADEISDGYEIRMGLDPLESADADVNSADDSMALAGDLRHKQVYDDAGYDPRTGWGENYLGKGTARELKGQENTVPFNNVEKFKASIYLAVVNAGAFSCDRFNDFALDPFKIDTDDDGIFDGWELYVGLNPKNKDDGVVVLDDDGLNNFQEFSAYDINLLRGDPWPNGSTHFDAAWINKVWPTDPNVADTDGDGLGDGVEGGYKNLDVPAGTDTSGSLDVLKYAGGELDWNKSCYVGGGLNPTTCDTDGDAMPDVWESVSYQVSTVFDFEDSEARDGMDGTVKDAGQDYDADGLANYQEYLTGGTYHWRYTEWALIGPGAGLGGYDPMTFFTGTPLAWDWNLEINKVPYFYIPKYAANKKVYFSSSNPREEDTDGDGMDDYWEVYHGLNPVFGVRDVHASMILDAWVAVGDPGSWDVRIAPFGAGSPFSDPDQDGLPNFEESLQANAATPYYYHTDPSPSWMTDVSYQGSFVNLYYDLGSLALNWWWAKIPPSYMYSFEDNEGFDSDHDMIGDRAEIVATQVSSGSSDPMNPEMPIKRRALKLDGDAAARTRGNFLHDLDDLTEFTVEAWVRSDEPAMGRMQVIIERPVWIPNGNVMNSPEGIRRNFRIALNEEGKPFASYTGSGYDGLEYEDVIAQGTSALEADRWYHLAATFDGDQSKLFLFVDGQMRASIASAERPVNGWSTGNPAWVFDAPLVVGAADKNPIGRVNGTPILVGPMAGTVFEDPDLDNFFEGYVDEVRIWNNPKSPAEIRAQMNLPLGLQDVIDSQQAALTVTTNKTPELMYLYNFDNLFDPGEEGIVPAGFDLLNGRPNDGSYPGVPWWTTAPDKSVVYSDYVYVPWLVNLAARAPLDPPADSPYNIQMGPMEFSDTATNITVTTNIVTTNNVTTTNVTTTTNISTNVTSEIVQLRSYPNTANPYNLAYYHASSLGGELYPDFFQDEFTPRRSPLFNDLLPLRQAFVDSTVDLWDGAGTGQSLVYDTNEDGIPDWWEEQYGFDPTGPSIAEEDPDSDGISNYWEFRLGTDPFNTHSLDANISDANYDSDGDTLSNLEEIQRWGSHPDNPDTDDDTIRDDAEVKNNASALYSRSPLVPRSMVLDGTPVAVPEPQHMIAGVISPQRFQSLDRWYLAARVRPDAAQTGSLIRRNVDSGEIQFELGLANNIPFVQFETLSGALFTASGTAALPTDRFSSVLAHWSPTNNVLSLMVDDCVVGSEQVVASCIKGTGETLIGDGITGYIDDVFIGRSLIGDGLVSPDYVLMIDVSGSMGAESRMEEAIAASLVAINGMPSGASMAIITFDHSVEQVQEFTTDKTILTALVNSLTPLGATSYSAPVTQMIELITDRVSPGGYVGILISDGQPNSGVPSDADLAEVVNLGAKINTVGFGSSILAGSTYDLERIATMSGGTFFPAPSGDELSLILSALVSGEASEDYAFYPFDDGGTYSEDYTQLLDWDYALLGVMFDETVFSTIITPFNYSFVDSDEEMPQWWIDWFLANSDEKLPTDDPDGDGVSNLSEWRISYMSQQSGLPGISPMLYDSDGDGQSDGDEDPDGDTLISRDEETNHKSRADRFDTDDDELNDNEELRGATDPAYSMIPFVMRALRFGPVGGTGEVLVEDRVRGVDTEHLGAEEWTVECYVQPEIVPAVGVDHPLIQRRLRCNDWVNYEVGIRNDGSGQIIPYVRFNHFNDGNVEELTTSVPMAIDEWAHVAGRLSGGQLSLFLNGEEVRAVNTSYNPAQGQGDTHFGGDGLGGAGFVGRLKDIRIWKIGRSNSEIKDFRNRGLIFDARAADPGLLRVAGDTGHLREVADPGTERDQLTEWTLECWVRTTDSAGTIISRVNGGNVVEDTDDFNYAIQVGEDGRLVGRFAIQWREATANTNGTTTIGDVIINTTINNLVSALPVNDGVWHHVAYTHDEESAVLYIDGELAGIQDGFLVPISISPNYMNLGIRILDGPVEIGRSLEGDIDEVRIWKRALTPTELDSVMSQNLYGNEPGLVTYFNFDFQQGSHAEDRASVRDPAVEYGTYIPNATHVSTSDQAPIENFFPLRVYAFTALLGYYPADDGGDTLENLLYQNDWDYAGQLVGDVAFGVLPAGLKPFLDDSDGDGLPDWWETLVGLNPGSDRDGDGTYGDPDQDGLSNWGEWLAGLNSLGEWLYLTMPMQYDTDGDGIGDYDSPATGPSYGSLTMDGDHMPDAWEATYSSEFNHLLDDPSIERYDDESDPDADGWDNLSEYLGSGFDVSSTTTTTGEGTNQTTQTTETVTPVAPTRANDAMSYPVPRIAMTFESKAMINLGDAPLIIWAFSDPDMGRPDAITVVPTSNDFVNGMSFAVERWDEGHVLQGQNIFMAFIDANTDGIWNAGEWMGYSENGTENIQWGSSSLRFALLDKPAGYIRFSWEQNMAAIQAALSQVNGTTYLVELISLTEARSVFMRTNDLQSMSRAFITEKDLQQAGVPPMNGSYKWLVGSVNGTLFASGTNYLTYPDALDPTVILSPPQTFTYAQEKLRMELDPNAAQIQILVRNPASGQILLNVTNFAPYVDSQGIAEIDLPFLAGFGVFTNGEYSIGVRASNPRTASNSGWMNFGILLREPSQNGPAMICGNAKYFGWDPDAPVVVEAYAGSGFGQSPSAKVSADANCDYQLMGLPFGDFHVRAFHDYNENGLLDAGEGWGLLKGTRSDATVSAPSIYSPEYLVKRIEIRSAVDLCGNSLIIHDIDSDRDLLPDMWELLNMSSLSQMNGGSDYNEDGVLDIVAYWNGTDPRSTDTDNDSLPDWWEIMHGLDPLSASGDGGRWGDPDGDGIINELEYAADTSPTKNLVPEVTGGKLVNGGSHIALSYEVSGIMPATVVVESKTSLDSDSWTTESQSTIYKAGGYTNTVPTAAGSAHKFFRVRMED